MRPLRQVKIFLLFSAIFLIPFSQCSLPAFAHVPPDAEQSRFILSGEEELYLNELRERPIKIAYSYDLAHTGNADAPGMLEPVLDVLRNVFGLEAELIKADWDAAFLLVENGEADFYGPVAISEARSRKYITVNPFYRSYSKMITRTDSPVYSMLGLYNRTVGLLTNSVISKTTKTYLGPRGQTVYFPTMDDMIAGLESGEVDAFATVDNAEYELLANDSLQFEFSMENFYVDQGLISGREDMRTLASLLNRYIAGNPAIREAVSDARRQALINYSRSRLSGEIAGLREKYSAVSLYADAALYPLCYAENGQIKGMQLEINEIFEELTGVKIRFVTSGAFPDGVQSAIRGLKDGSLMAIVGGYFSDETWRDPAIGYSPPLWQEKIRTYSFKDIGNSLSGKSFGALRHASDYLVWDDPAGEEPVLFNSYAELKEALESGLIDAVFMGEMNFNYGYLVLDDYRLREVSAITADVPVHVLYGTQNESFNALFDQSMALFQILNPRSLGQWRAKSNQYQMEDIRIRNIQQTWTTVIIVVFVLVLVMAFCMLIYSRKAHKRTQALLADVEEKRATILAGIGYSSKIQRSMLPRAHALSEAFPDCAVIWEPRDIVGGDIYWLKIFPGGTTLCVCDCTGHGTSGALLTMLVAAALEDIVDADKCADTAGIIWELEQRLVSVFNVEARDGDRPAEVRDGCDLAVLYVSKSGNVTVSAANIHVFVCDGKEVRDIKGQRLFVGEGKLSGPGEIDTVEIAASPANKFYIATDGLFDQIGGEPPRPFGYKRFRQIMIDSHGESMQSAAEEIWQAFEAYRGGQPRRDDVELIAFKP